MTLAEQKRVLVARFQVRLGNSPMISVAVRLSAENRNRAVVALLAVFEK
jgi:hypothetical protein